MAERFDLVIGGGMIVNQDSIWEGDIGVNDGRFAGSALFRATRPANISTRGGCTCCPA